MFRIFGFLLTAVFLFLIAACAGGPPAVSDAEVSAAVEVNSETAASERTEPEKTRPAESREIGKTAEIPESGIEPPFSEGEEELPRDTEMAEPEIYENIELKVTAIMKTMSLEEKAGQVFMPGTGRDALGRPIRSVNRQLQELIRRMKPGGIILFTENISDIPQTLDLVSGMQELSTIPLFISTDQEGGVVSRLTSAALHATMIPSQAEVGTAGRPDLAEKLGLIIARELRSLGINMNMAPVADINTNPNNPVIGATARAYSSDPEETADMVEAAVQGMQRGGISAVLKHFPGHGDTKEDSHSSLAVIPHELQRLQKVEFVPFRRGIDAGVDGIMTGHISVPAVTGGSEPATLSPVLLQEILRKDLGFNGIIITDSLVMGALSRFYGKGELAVQAFKAGVDIILRPAFPLSSYEALLESIRSGEISEERLDESVRRILRVKVLRGLFESAAATGNAEEVLGNEEHRSFVEELLNRAQEIGNEKAP